MWEPFFQSVLSASSAISSSKGERRGGERVRVRDRCREGDRAARDKTHAGWRRTIQPLPPLSSRLKKIWRRFSGGLQPSRLEVSARCRWMVWRDSARLCETITGEIWGPADLPFVLDCLSSPPSLSLSHLLVLSYVRRVPPLRLAPFHFPGHRCLCLPHLGLTCMAPVTFNRTNESRLNFSLVLEDLLSLLAPRCNATFQKKIAASVYFDERL